MTTWFMMGTSSGFGRHLTELLLEGADRTAATCRKIDRYLTFFTAFCPMLINFRFLRIRHVRLDPETHLDEVFIKMNRVKHYGEPWIIRSGHRYIAREV